MLGKIKSSYFVKIVFSLMNAKNKLKVIKYNKSLENIIDINIINYKIFSGRYLIYESNTKVKEYNSYDNKLIFEG